MIYEIMTTAFTSRSNNLFNYWNSRNARQKVCEHFQYENTNLLWSSTEGRPEPLPLTIGTSLNSWPKRDINCIAMLQRDDRSKKVLFHDNTAEASTPVIGKVPFNKAGNGANNRTEVLLKTKQENMSSEE